MVVVSARKSLRGLLVTFGTAHLSPVQLGINPAAGQEFAVSPGLDDPAVVDDDDPVGIDDRRQAVRDDDRRSSA